MDSVVIHVTPGPNMESNGLPCLLAPVAIARAA